ncbi:hypothetical protein [Kitasatospora terrestris]
MRKNSSLRARTAAVLVAGLLAGGVLAAPAALAAEPAKQYLTTTMPEAIGLGGRPAGTSNAISNPGTTVLKAQLKVTADIGFQAPAGWFVINFSDDANGGTAKPVPLTFANGVYSGTVPVTVTVQPGQIEILHLLVGTPLGGPGNGATNGGIESVKLRTTLVAEGTTEPLGEVERTVPVRGITPVFSPVPGQAVAGGAGIEFESGLTNNTRSDYDRLSDVLYTAAGAKVETRLGDGSWKTLAAVPGAGGEGRAAFRLDGPGAELLAMRSAGHRVRVSYPAGTPLGATEIGHCAIVNERVDRPLVGTTMCGEQAKVTVVAPTTPAPTTPAPTTPAPTTPASATTAAAAPVTGALQDGAGDGVLWFGRRRSA